MTDEPRDQAPTVQIVFDDSTIAAFIRGSAAVGEMLSMVHAEGGAVIVPTTCFLNVAATIADGHDWLKLLKDHPVTFVLSDDPDDWQILADLRKLLGDAGLASAAWFAIDCDVDVFTAHPSQYSKIRGGDLALPIEETY